MELLSSGYLRVRLPKIIYLKFNYPVSFRYLPMSILDDYEREMRNGEEEEAAVAARGEKRRNTYRTVPDG